MKTQPIASAKSLLSGLPARLSLGPHRDSRHIVPVIQQLSGDLRAKEVAFPGVLKILEPVQIPQDRPQLSAIAQKTEGAWVSLAQEDGQFATEFCLITAVSSPELPYSDLFLYSGTYSAGERNLKTDFQIHFDLQGFAQYRQPVPDTDVPLQNLTCREMLEPFSFLARMRRLNFEEDSGNNFLLLCAALSNLSGAAATDDSEFPYANGKGAMTIVFLKDSRELAESLRAVVDLLSIRRG